MKAVFYRLIYIGVSDGLKSYEAKRIKIFNYCNLFGFMISFVKAVYISFISANNYSTLTIVMNMLPLLLCVIMSACMHHGKYKAATYISFFCFPPALFLIYASTLDISVSIFLILYFIFPFFFLHRPRNIVAAFTIAVFSLFFIHMGDEFQLLFYEKTYYPFDAALAYIDFILGMLFVFALLFSIKFMVWKYEKSIKKKNHELKELNLFKDKIISVVSHDLRSPMASTAQLIDMLGTVRMDQEEFKMYLSELQQEMGNTMGLMDNLLVWAKRQIEERQIKPDHTRISSLVDETLRALNKLASNKQVRIVNEVHNSYSAFVDKDTIMIVVRNLVSNAIKFTPAGGVITIRATENNQNQVIVEVQDSGVGIPPEKQEMVLGKEYYTTPGTAKEKGSGLGLKICRSMIEKNNGLLSFKSEVGVGTTFYLALPASESMDNATQQPEVVNNLGFPIPAIKL